MGMTETDLALIREGRKVEAVAKAMAEAEGEPLTLEWIGRAVVAVVAYREAEKERPMSVLHGSPTETEEVVPT